MRCVYCNNDTQVTRTTVMDDNTIRRERKCKTCGKKYGTIERLDSLGLFVRKSAGNREPYQQQKLRSSIEIAAGKAEGRHRRLRANAIDAIVGAVEGHIIRMTYDRGTDEVDSKDIGMMTLRELRDRDYGAFIRYLSVFEENILQKDELRKLLDEFARIGSKASGSEHSNSVS